MKHPTARERLIAIQRSLTAKTKGEIYESLGVPVAELGEYYERYQRLFLDHRGPVDMDTLLAEVSDAQILYFGDYHTLRESQKAQLRILRKLIGDGRPTRIATEVVHLIHQDHLDAFLAGSIDESKFRRRVDYDRTWGFSWRNYSLQFQFARQHGIPMLAINSDPAVVRDNLEFRDTMAAMVIVEAIMREPESRLAVFFGDLHVAPEHLPAQVERFLERRNVPRGPRAFLYQNSEAIYWDLAASGLEQTTHAVRLRGERSYCLMNTPPLVKFQSYLNWELNQEELEESFGLEEDPSISSHVMTDQVLDLVRTITGFLEIPIDGLDTFTVHTSRDLDFLTKLEESGRFSEEELEEIRSQIARDESYFITRDHIIYLGNLSLDHAAEEATHYINTVLAGHVEVRPDRRFDFYYRVLKEALGFLGSRIINPKRSCWGRKEFEEVDRELRGKRLDPRTAEIRAVARDVLSHLDFEDRRRRGEVSGFPRHRAVYRRELPVHLGVTHALGYLLGQEIHEALLAGRLGREPVHALFHERFEAPDSPRILYFEWKERVAPAAAPSP